MRVAILGNSGSGKSTLAHWLAARSGAALLDLDTIAWEAGKVVVARIDSAARADTAAFCDSHPHWVVEGCYANLITETFKYRPRLIFLNPGEAQCLANCRARPWEPHKYGSQQEQDERLAFLLLWVREYYTRDGEMSLAAHRACFEGYAGPKCELTVQPQFDPPSPELIAFLG